MSDGDELRAYMERYGSLREDRSTESYALEFLRTADENLQLAQARANLTLAVGQMRYFASWVKELLEKLPAQIERVEELSKGEVGHDQTGAAHDE